MFGYWVVVSGIVMGLLAWSGQASAGWIIDQVVKGEGGQQQVMLQANRMKTLTLEGGKPVAAFIIDLDTQTITQVDYKERYYFSAPVREFVQTMRETMAGAMKEMQDAMKGLSPEQRKMMEQMMGSQMGAASPACREPRVELRKTGQQATIAGYPAVRHDVITDGKLSSELWIARGITAWREVDGKKLELFGAEMAKLAGCPSQGRQALPGSDPSWKLASEGYPVRTVERGGSGVTVEVVKAERRTISEEELQPPSGFAPKTLGDIMRR